MDENRFSLGLPEGYYVVQRGAVAQLYRPSVMSDGTTRHVSAGIFLSAREAFEVARELGDYNYRVPLK